MGHGKKKKSSKRKDKVSGKGQETSKGEVTAKKTEKRGHERDRADLSDDTRLDTRSPRSKTRKVLNIMVKNVENPNGNEQEDSRMVEVSDVNKIAEDTTENSGDIPEEENGRSDRVRTRSSGALTEEDLAAKLPEGKKKKSQKTVPPAELENVDDNKSEVNTNQNNTRRSNLGGEVQIEVNADEDKFQDESSEGDTSSDSESTSSSADSESTSSSDEQAAGGHCSTKGTKKRKRKYRSNESTTSSTDESEEEFHRRLLKENPGLRQYLLKKKDKQKRRKRRREHKKKKDVKRRNKRGKSRSKGKIASSPSNETLYAQVLSKIPVRQSPQITPAKQDRAIAKGIERIRLSSGYGKSSNSQYSSDAETSTDSDSSDQSSERRRRTE